MEKQHLIRIVKGPDFNSFAFPGETISEEDFKKWIEYAENSPTLSLNEAKQKWEHQKEKLQKLIP